MILLGSERQITQNYEQHGKKAEDYAGDHLSEILIKGKAKVISVVNKYTNYNDTIDYNDYLKNKGQWKDGVYYNCVSVGGTISRYHQSELGGNQVRLECYNNNEKIYLRILHMAEVYVRVGDIINSSTVIGRQGNTGLVSSKKERSNRTYGSHVHFEVLDKNYVSRNPRDYATFKNEVNYLEQTNEIDNSKDQIKIIADKINIRLDSNIGSTDLGDVYKDEIYTIYNKVEDEQYTWYQIKTSLGVIGYVANEKGKNWLEVHNQSNPVEGNHQPVDDNNQVQLVFECEKDGLYAITLKSGEKLYIK